MVEKNISGIPYMLLSLLGPYVWDSIVEQQQIQRSGCENAKRNKEECEAILCNDANSTKLLKNVIEKGIKQLETFKKRQLVHSTVGISALNAMDADTGSPPEKVMVIDFGDITIPTLSKSEALKTAGLYCSPIEMKQPDMLSSVDSVPGKINEDKCAKVGNNDFSKLRDISAVIIEKNEHDDDMNGPKKVNKLVKHRRRSRYGVRRKIKKYEEIDVASMSEGISLNTNYIKNANSEITIVDEKISKKCGNVAVEQNNTITMYSSPKENELDMSYTCEADDETEDSMTAIDGNDDMLNVTAIVKSKAKEVIQESGETKLCTSVDTNVVDQDMVADKKTSKPLKGIMRKSQSSTHNDVKKKVEFCNMSLWSTRKSKCNSSDSDPDAVIIISPPKKLSNSKKKEGIGKKDALETKGSKKTGKKITVKPVICVGKVKKGISSPRRKTRSSNDMVPKGNVSNESTNRNHAATKGTTSSMKQQKSKEENKKEKGNNKEKKGNKKDKKKNDKEAVKMVKKNTV